MTIRSYCSCAGLLTLKGKGVSHLDQQVSQKNIRARHHQPTGSNPKAKGPLVSMVYTLHVIQYTPNRTTDTFAVTQKYTISNKQTISHWTKTLGKPENRNNIFKYKFKYYYQLLLDKGELPQESTKVEFTLLSMNVSC